MRLTPRDAVIFPLLRAQAALPSVACGLLVTMIGSTVAERSEILERMRAVERDAAQARSAVLDRVVASFVTPYDREDLYRLATALDACVDEIARTGDRVAAARLPRLPEPLVAQVESIQRCSELVDSAGGEFSRMTALRDVCVQLSGLVSHSRRAHERFVADLLAGHSDAGIDPLEMIRLSMLADALVRALERFRDLAQIVETIAVKEA
ncbi:DUF47 domain-containing protein [Serinibacter salmoneus]|uniref:DUF47 domain-containing protein n=1 Tax=Serinibacter salmoneus TaxID=556530 RepID=UPI001472E8C5|nr:DUF47 family protein [Serinibacter salmoneus]